MILATWVALILMAAIAGYSAGGVIRKVLPPTPSNWDLFGRLFDRLLNEGVSTIDLHTLNPSSDDPAFWVSIDGGDGEDHRHGSTGYAVGDITEALAKARNEFHTKRAREEAEALRTTQPTQRKNGC